MFKLKNSIASRFAKLEVPKTCPICKLKIDFRPAHVTNRTASLSRIHCPKCDLVMYGRHFIPSIKGLLSPKQRAKSENKSNAELISRWNNRASKLKVWLKSLWQYLGRPVDGTGGR